MRQCIAGREDVHIDLQLTDAVLSPQRRRGFTVEVIQHHFHILLRQIIRYSITVTAGTFGSVDVFHPGI